MGECRHVTRHVIVFLLSNSYYGEFWATLTYNDLEQWISSQSSDQRPVADEGSMYPQPVLEEGENLISCNVSSLKKVTNIVQSNYSREQR